jgi:hypothetical protein
MCISRYQHSLGSRRAYTFSEAGFSSQNGDSTWRVFYRRAAFSCAFLWAKGLNVKDIHKQMFRVYDGKCLSCKTVHKWVEKFSQGRSKVAGRPVEIATEATVQWVEELIWADRITINSAATALGCTHGLAYSIMHDHLKFQKVCTWWVPKELMDWEKLTKWVCSCNISYGMQMKGKICLGGLLLETKHRCITTKPNQSVIQCTGNIPVHLQPKKFKAKPAAGKVMLTVFWDS